MNKILRNFFTFAFVALASAAQAQVVFSETFDKMADQGGNDGKWSGRMTSTPLTDGAQTTDAFDVEGWNVTKAYTASNCIKMGTGKAAGTATTPTFHLTGSGTLTFRAGAWSSSSEKTTLTLSATGATLSVASVEMKKGEFSEYTVQLTDAQGDVTITFAASVAASNRYFLDDVKVVGAATPVKPSAELSFAQSAVNAVPGKAFTAPTLTNPHNVTVTYSSSDDDVAAVDAATGAITIGEPGVATITAASAETDMYAASKATYTISVLSTFSSIKDYVAAMGTGQSAVLQLTDATVVYVNKYTGNSGENTELYVRDASGAIIFYNAGLDYPVGTMLNGSLVATYKPHYDLPEITATDDVQLTTTEGTAAPTQLEASAVSAANYCDLVTVKGVYTAADKKIAGVLALYDKYKNGELDKLMDGQEYIVTGTVGSFKNTPQLNIISATIATGVKGVTADVNADAPTYNMAGQRVNAQYKGVVVRNGKKFVQR